MVNEILCLHSSGLSGAQWARLAKALSPSYLVHTPDLLGYGACQEPYQRPFDCQQDLHRLLLMLERPTIIIGHSYGGFLGLHLALRAPGLVKALVLFDPIAWGALRSSDPAAMELATAPRFTKPEATPEEWLESFVEFWGEPGSWEKISPKARQSMVDSYPKMREEVASLVNDRTPHTEYEKLRLPTLLITGQRSPRLQQEVNTALAGAIHAAQFELMPGGHMAPITHGEEFLKLVQTFLGREH